ncbi:MAG: PEGA domain-containing protein [Planctomycetes bacterium]|nr:PEGA domain-containing protein [Planctomycetota bacterium]MCC7168900.1 PEGA domain-containing protein [Planctomycetota bacterium]
MKRTTALLTLILATLALPACVERTLTIVTVPDAADVYLDGRFAGKSPVTLPFSYYGTREIVVRKPGYRVERHLETMTAPHFQQPPWDLYYETLTSNLYVDAWTFPYVLTPQTEADVSEEAVRQKMLEAKELRERS